MAHRRPGLSRVEGQLHNRHMPFMPPFIAPTFHHDADSALAQVRAIYSQQINHLREAMQRFVAGESLSGRFICSCPSLTNSSM